MKKSEITIGKTYRAKISGKIAPVRIDAESRHGGWDATNLTTKKKVRIKSAAKLRSKYNPRPREEATPANTATPKAKPAKKATTTAKPTKNATRAKLGGDNAKTGGTGDSKDKKPSGLDAAVRVLKENGKPMRCKQIVETMLDKGYWKTTGKTPQATIYAAIIREIEKKGDDARFIKIAGERGLFTLDKEV